MNSIKTTGDLTTEVRYKADKGSADFIMAVPFAHPFMHVDADYRTKVRTYLYGENAEWAADTLYEGAHLEIKYGYIRTWYMYKYKRSYYRIIGLDVDKERSVNVPDDYEPQNIARLGGMFRTQWLSGETDEGVHKVGISIAAAPDFQPNVDKRDNMISVILYDEQADMIDGKLQRGDKIDYIEGVMQAFRGSINKTFGLYVNATDIKV